MSIRSKIKGEAAINIANSRVNNWAELKDALLNAYIYTEIQEISILNIELVELNQKSNETAVEFYNKV